MKKTLSKKYFKACIIEMLLHLELLAFIIIGICYVTHSKNILEWLIIIFLSLVISYKSLKVFSYKYPEAEYEELENKENSESDLHFKECPFNYCDSNPKCEGKCRYDD